MLDVWQLPGEESIEDCSRRYAKKKPGFISVFLVALPENSRFFLSLHLVYKKITA